MPIKERQIIDSHLDFAQQRGDDKTYCPSEVARALFLDDWRDKMDVVRRVADKLVQEKKLFVLQKGIIQSSWPSELKGPIRLRIRNDEE